MERHRFGQFEVQREEPLQQLSDLSVLLAAMHFVWRYTKQEEHVKT
jgi:hypothetical protein